MSRVRKRNARIGKERVLFLQNVCSSVWVGHGASTWLGTHWGLKSRQPAVEDAHRSMQRACERQSPLLPPAPSVCRQTGKQRGNTSPPRFRKTRRDYAHPRDTAANKRRPQYLLRLGKVRKYAPTRKESPWANSSQR